MIYRIDVRWASPARAGEAGIDPLGQAIRQQIIEFADGVQSVSTSRVFLIETNASRQHVRRVAAELLADPIVENAELFDSPPPDAQDQSRIEIHLKPGVMDPVAASTEMAIRDMGIDVREVRTGRAYSIRPKLPREQLEQIASRVLANGVIESVHLEPYLPRTFERGHEAPFHLRHIELCRLDDEGLRRLSRDGHLFLSLIEMKAIQLHYRKQERDPTDVELETLAQTWSEHCVHKTLKSAVEVLNESGQVLRRYDNLIAETIFDSTMRLINSGKRDFCLSVFKDNAGVIALDETHAVCFKVETHNHPSAIEPYGGSATGVGGVIRDVLGTGLGAQPIANTDVFCVAFPNRDPATRDEEKNRWKDELSSWSLPQGILHPKRTLHQVVAGVRDYGNRMGIPTVNGAVYFDDRYIGNPLVFCGCIGLIPRDRIHKQAYAGDAIVLMGGRTGRDGIHGATFSSAELTQTHADEFSHAVQIGNAITEKKMADVILRARDRGLFTAITDCGAGGLSSAVGEMGEKIGAYVQLDRVPLKYAGLRYDEIWISEAQERMVLSVPDGHVTGLLELAESEDVEATVIGHFGTENRDLILHYRGDEVGRLSMDFLHGGLPTPKRRAVITDVISRPMLRSVEARYWGEAGDTGNVCERLLKVLAHPNVASKHWIIRQYDHEVQGGSVVKPLVGPLQVGPSDAAVIRPRLDRYRGVAIACGLAPHIHEPYAMAIASIDEAVRNAVCVGANPDKLAILDNFCWPSCDDERTLGALVRACEACRDAALAYGVPFISGKDSLNNQFTNSVTGEVIRIPNTLLISAIGVVEDVRKCVTMDLKDGTDRLVLVRPVGDGLESLARTHRAVAAAIDAGMIRAAHDVSDGGVLVTVAEMCIASGLGATLPLAELPQELPPFAEATGTYVLSVRRNDTDALLRKIGNSAELTIIGDASPAPMFSVCAPDGVRIDVHLDELTAAWRGTLDW